MERIVIILQSLLVILATAHVATGCSCSELDFISVLCDSSSTVIRASVISAETTGDEYGNPLSKEIMPHTKFEMQLHATFKKGPNEISTRVNMFHIVSEGEMSQCGFSLEPGTDYILIGDVNNEGTFGTDLCSILQPEDVSKSDMDLLEGKTAVINCVENL